MENENQSDELKFPIDYDEKIEQQEKVVGKATESRRKNPSADSALEFDRAMDLLLHYLNAAKENPKARAQLTAEFARRIVLNKAIQPIPIEE